MQSYDKGNNELDQRANDQGSDESYNDIDELSFNKYILENMEDNRLRISNIENFKKVPVSLMKFKNLKVLDIEQPELELIPSWIDTFSDLGVFRLRNCENIETLPIRIFLLKQLKILSILRSGLRQLSEHICELEHLRVLHLSGSRITMLPESIGKLKNLVEFDLSGCSELNLLPESLSNLSNLTHLELGGTAICVLPISIGNLTKLEYLGISKTDVRGFHPSIYSLRALNRFMADDCKKLIGLPSLSELPDEACWPNLEHLSFDGCERFSYLPNIMNGLGSLKTLNLNSTAIEFLPSWVTTHKKLQNLLLAFTRLEPPLDLNNLHSCIHINTTEIEVDGMMLKRVKFARIRGLVRLNDDDYE